MKLLVLIIILIALAFLFAAAISQKNKIKKTADKEYVDILKSTFISTHNIAPNSGSPFTEESMNSAVKDFKNFVDFAATLGEDNERD